MYQAVCGIVILHHPPPTQYNTVFQDDKPTPTLPELYNIRTIN